MTLLIMSKPDTGYICSLKSDELTTAVNRQSHAVTYHDLCRVFTESKASILFYLFNIGSHDLDTFTFDRLIGHFNKL